MTRNISFTMVSMSKAKKEDNDEDYPEIAYESCDGCNKDFPIEEVEVCPSSWEEVKHGIRVNSRFCNDCCEESFEHQGCQSEVGNCDRATELMAQSVKKYAENNGFSPFEGKPHVYLDESRVFCIADNGISVEEIFEDKLVYLPDENMELWEGEETCLVKPFHNEVSYSKYLVNEISKIFEELGCYKGGFFFLKSKKLLVVTSDGMWGVLAPRENKEDYGMEKSAFIRNIEHGYRFFEIGKKDGLVLVDTKRMEFEWTKLTDQDFVGLCFDIFKSLPRIVEVEITDGTGDLGQDIKAIEAVPSLTGETKRKCTIQCKHFPSRKVAPSDIEKILNSYSQLKFDVFCLMTSNLLFPSCRRMLDAWNSPRFPFEVVTWDVKKIEDYVRDKPRIYARYFSK